MPALKLTIQAEVDGVPVSGFPFVRRVTLDKAITFEYEQAETGFTDEEDTIPAFVALIGAQLSTIKALILRPSAAALLRLDGQSDAGIQLNPNGLLVILDGVIDAGAGASNAKVHTSGASTLKGVVAGS